MPDYDKPPELYEGLRLHQNENTAGCSPRVLAALAALRADQISVYPPYADVMEACARHFGVDSSSIALTNGLDEGILAVAIAFLRAKDAALAPEVVIPQPAFEIFEFTTSVVGGRTIKVPPAVDFIFPIDAVLSAITARTRIVFVTNPNNPTGTSTTMEDIKAVARRVPADGVVFVDEAYAEFANGRTFIPDLAAFPNVVVGRTFAKAYGLAGLRLGALLAAPDTLNRIKPAIGVYSVNVAAVVAIKAALSDRAFIEDYVRQVDLSKTLVYDACDRLNLQYWKSDANFVLIRVGDHAARVVSEAAARGVYLRDRSGEPGCAGCIRMTTGIVDHTRRGLAVLEEVLCVAG
jgi:histidinol-phosphate aminotransferase